MKKRKKIPVYDFISELGTTTIQTDKIYKGAKKALLHFNELTLSFIEEFDRYLGKPLTLAVRVHVHCAIKRLIVRAKKDGLIKYNPYDDFEIPLYKFKAKPSLTEEQVRALENVSDEEL